jgi:hypothetical protein
MSAPKRAKEELIEYLKTATESLKQIERAFDSDDDPDDDPDDMPGALWVYYESDGADKHVRAYFPECWHALVLKTGTEGRIVAIKDAPPGSWALERVGHSFTNAELDEFETSFKEQTKQTKDT